MEFWVFFSLVLATIVAIKSYIIRGVWQASRNRAFTAAYAFLSLGSLAIGAYTMITVFPQGIIGMSLWANLRIALLCSVVVCELLLLPFFLLDDMAILLSWLMPKKAEAAGEPNATEGRRRFLKTLGLGLAAIPFSSFLYGITKGKYDFRVFRETLSFPDLPEAFDGFKVLQFSDLHSGGFDSLDAVRQGFDLIQRQGADLILFTGDLVNDLAEEILPYKSLMGGLQAPAGKFAVLGNHDYPMDREMFPDKASGEANLRAIRQHHREMGFQLLDNANAKIERKGQHIRLLGVENWGHGFIQAGDLDQALEGCPDGEFNILMSHDPTHWEEKVLEHERHIHLTLAGHTHGMQMGIELLGIKWSPVQYLYKRWAGLYQELGQYLYVNRGFGFMAFAGRVGIPPEITVITLRRG